MTPGDAQVRLELIADDSLQGRFLGSSGHERVTKYLASEVARLGLRPGGENGSYFQDIPFLRRSLVDQSLAVEGEQLQVGQDYVPFHPGGRIRGFNGAEVIYGGVLGDTARQVTREQAAGKFVILVYRNPRNTAGNIRTARPGDRLGTAAAIATVNPDVAMDGWRRGLENPRPVYTGADDPQEVRVAGFAITAHAAERLLGVPADTTLRLGVTGKVVQGHVAFRDEPVNVRNVVAILPGSDSIRSNEYVAIGAHSDHIAPRTSAVDHDSLRLFNALRERRQRELNTSFLSRQERASIQVNVDSLRAVRPARLDSINNGADDDGSGVVALLEIAESLAAIPTSPARSILFVWHAAEEEGLRGSQYFTDHPTVPRGAIIAQLNLDMIGRGRADDLPDGGARYLQLVGANRLSSELGNLILQVNERQETPFSWDMQYDQKGHPEQIYCRSDHYNYARYGIPVAFFSTGLHRDYHTVTDEPSYIDYPKLTRVARLVKDVAIALATLDRRPVVDGPLPNPEAPCVQ